jgi:alpha-galactosidase
MNQKLNLWIKIIDTQGESFAHPFAQNGKTFSAMCNLSETELLTLQLVECTHTQSSFSKSMPTHQMWELKILQSANHLRPLKSISILNFPLGADEDQCLANGLQCWTESPLLLKHESLLNETIPARAIFGDHNILQSSERSGEIHSWSFSYTNAQHRTHSWLYAALCEDSFLSAFQFHFKKQTFDIFIDCEGFSGNVSLGRWIFPVSNLNHTEQNQLTLPLHEQVKNWMTWVRHFEEHPRSLTENMQKPRRVPIKGYTSWYLHYNKINETILLNNVGFMSDLGPQDVFQIDDGYQRQVGDWLHFSPGFPNGVAHIAAIAKQKGMSPGIWFAPFIAVEGSEIMLQHPDWLLLNDQNEKVLCGTHPLWGGNFYALDTENESFWKHIEKVLDCFLTEWGFEFIKADFLYATAVQVCGQLTRAQRSVRAHERLYQLIHQRGAKFLSCGAVLSSAYMRCDYSRIGPDVCESWENDEFGAVQSREKVSTRASLVNTFTRSPLSQTAFGNDPDVFILRDHNTTLTEVQRKILCEANFKLGDLVFTSDDVTKWNNELQKTYLKNASLQQNRQSRQMLCIEKSPEGLYSAHFSSNPQGPEAQQSNNFLTALLEK